MFTVWISSVHTAERPDRHDITHLCTQDRLRSLFNHASQWRTSFSFWRMRAREPGKPWNFFFCSRAHWQRWWMRWIYIALFTKALYNKCLSFTHTHNAHAHTHTHTHTHVNGESLPCKTPISSSGTIRAGSLEHREGSNRDLSDGQGSALTSPPQKESFLFL